LQETDHIRAMLCHSIDATGLASLEWHHA